jgi:predicted anti-sigma-YlaC factor YlaD
MHEFIRDRLERLLSSDSFAVNPNVADHLSSCGECSAEVKQMAAQAAVLRTLKLNEEVEPVPGFYARVMQRIEERAAESMWSAFLSSSIGKKLVYASLTIALMLGSYVVTQESRDGHLGSEPMLAQEMDRDVLVAGSQAEQRDAVLKNFAVRGTVAAR